MRLCKKILWMFIIINIALLVIYFNKFEVRATSIGDMEKQASSFIEAGQKAANGEDLTSVTDAVTSNFKGLGQFLTMIGAGIMVAAASYMGIMYIISPPDKQAALKQQLIGLVVAGIVIFGAYGIWKAVLGIVSNF